MKYRIDPNAPVTDFTEIHENELDAIAEAKKIAQKHKCDVGVAKVVGVVSLEPVYQPVPPGDSDD